jgi:cellulose synthase/poly-beta-1,6-N-acetylglucosamine synthase-like glycosyltransferase
MSSQTLLDLALPLSFIPIGILGIIRWICWLAKIIPAMFYRPVQNSFTASTTIVTPVYNEDPDLFMAALDSWLVNKPDRIIAVVDVSDARCAEIARDYARKGAPVQVIMTDVPGKRDALARGVDACQTEVVVLVDSDVVWEPDVLSKVVMPFADPKVGGVGTRQHMRPTDPTRPATVWERMNDIFLDLRYTAEVPATVVLGQAVSCLSGRTAAYRTTLLKSFRDEFMSETFNGRVCLSGDDKCYTTLTLKAGYKTYSQLNAKVYSTFKPDFRGFVKQRVRWSRNSLRSDLKALWQGWVIQHPYLAFSLLDKTASPFLLLVAPVALIIAALIGKWPLVLALLVWWLISRTIKLLPHLVRRPEHIVLVPLYVLVTFHMSLIKAYALLTINRHEWLTRNVAMKDGVAMRTAGGTSA